MNYTTIELTFDNHIASLNFNRPKQRHALNVLMIEELIDALNQVMARSCRVLLLSADGPCFSAGADLTWMQQTAAASQADNIKDALRFSDQLLRRLDSLPMLTIARVAGDAYGGGVGLLCTCDVVISIKSAHFSISEAKFGIIPSMIGPYLINTLGQRQARRLALTAMRFDATEALRVGLVHELADDLNELERLVADKLEQIALCAPQAVAEIKQLFRALKPQAVDDATVQLTAETIARIRASNEAKEGFTAFLEKRKAAWVS